MTTPEALEREHTLATATARFDQLRTWEALGEPALGQAEVLELLALSEVLSRKAAYGRQLSVRTARASGASWSQIGAALGTSKQAAWEAHARWIDDQAAQHGTTGIAGLPGAEITDLRNLAGDADS
ncbi:hypothetical protein [Asanoa iriomotensis]|uniref:DUF222 domain-containing protein n=1 Tax=Asanoa iriomotensis TaxID=234613 RepID=A0ABQ4C4J2_9ACTN|nr:hypothetical protein [Asanoa iriomotensis]GIF57674.1 hypothetical protein Air01nite_37690 [Asanoa iriomotensis]